MNNDEQGPDDLSDIVDNAAFKMGMSYLAHLFKGLKDSGLTKDEAALIVANVYVGSLNQGGDQNS